MINNHGPHYRIRLESDWDIVVPGSSVATKSIPTRNERTVPDEGIHLYITAPQGG